MLSLVLTSAAGAQEGATVEAQVSVPTPGVVVEADVLIPPPPPATTAPVEAVPVPPAATAPVVYVPVQPVQPVQPAPNAQSYSLAAPEMRMEHRMNRGLAIAGGVMFGGAWVVNILGSGLGVLAIFTSSTAGGLSSGDTFGASFIPVIGPLIFAGVAFSRPGSWEVFGGIGILDAAIQAAGLTMLIFGIIGEDVEVNARAENDLWVLPYASSQGAGLTAGGTW